MKKFELSLPKENWDHEELWSFIFNALSRLDHRAFIHRNFATMTFADRLFAQISMWHENNTEAASFFDDPIYGYFETKTKPEGPNTKITLIKLEDPKTNN